MKKTNEDDDDDDDDEDVKERLLSVEEEEMEEEFVRAIEHKDKSSIFLQMFYTKPVRLLIFLTFVNVLNYSDRGAVSGVLSYISYDIGIVDDETKQGMVAGAFTVGFMITNPIFTYLSQSYRPTKLMFGGLLCWTLASLATPFAYDLNTLLICRMLSGIGEASFAGLAPSMIDDIAPNDRKTVWLSMFFAAIPVGAAIGYSIAGAIAEFSSWKIFFFLQGILMFPMALIVYFLPKPPVTEIDIPQYHQHFHPADFTTFQSMRTNIYKTSFKESLISVCTNPVYVFSVIGYSAYTFVIGAFAFWSPQYLQEEHNLSPALASTAFGIITVITGLGGTAFGGWFIDSYLSKRYQASHTVLSLIFSMSVVIIALPFTVFVFFVPNVGMFIGAMFIAEFLLFTVTGPINGVILSSVTANLKSFAMGLTNLMIHLIGDFPSPILVGMMTGRIGLGNALSVCAMWNIWTILFWFLSWRSLAYYINKSEERRQEIIEGEHQEDFTSLG